MGGKCREKGREKGRRGRAGEGRKEKKCGSGEKSVREREKNMKEQRHFYTGHSVTFIKSIELKERS